MDHDQRARMSGAGLRDAVGADGVVRRAAAVPEVHLASELAGDVRAEVGVGQEHDFAVSRNRRDDLFGVARGAADVDGRLRRGGGVDVCDHDRFRVGGAIGTDFVGIRHVRHRAACVWRGVEDNRLGGKDLGGLGHETDAAEDDHRRVAFGGLARQLKRVAREVRDVLHLANGVVVREDDGVPFLFQPLNLFNDVHLQPPSLQ